MFETLLQTKLYLPPARPDWVARPRLLDRLARSPLTRLSLISAPAGYGKTTLVTAWLRQLDGIPICWLSLDEDDGDPSQFFRYLAAAIRPLPHAQTNLPQLLQAQQAMPAKALMAAFVQDVTAVPDPFILVLDDYHLVDSPEIDAALTFLLAHQPPQLHLVITTREDPNLPLPRLRVRSQLTELRAADLRFTPDEAAAFFRQTMGLTLPAEAITALEQRTEGWVAGLQLSALALQNQDVASVIESFGGGHHFVLDYLVAEVLQQQPAHVQIFLRETAVLDRFCAPLCDAVLADSAISSHDVLAHLARANLFLVPLDGERRWYRYHHLFADLLRQRLQTAQDEAHLAQLHQRASRWFEANNLLLEAFRHAAAANDVALAARLVEGDGLPLYFRGEATPVRRWLESLPDAEYRARPALWVTYASVLTLTGRLHGNIEEILQAAETALQAVTPDDKTADLLGQIAANRAMLGVVKNEVDKIITQSRLALEWLHPHNAPMRTTATWTLGYAYQVQGNWAAALEAYAETITQSQKSGNIMTEIAATTCMGQIQEAENQLQQAAETFQHILQLMGDPPWPAACEACVGLGRIHYQWNELARAEQYGQQGLALARQLENVDTPAACGLLLARVKLAQGDAAAALALLVEAEQFVQQHHFDHWVGEITAVRLQTYLHQGDFTAAAQLAENHDLPLSWARLHLAQGNPAAALEVLASVRRVAPEDRLPVLLQQALAVAEVGQGETAVTHLQEALTLAQPGGLIRPFVDEGPALARLLYEALSRGIYPAYVNQLLAAFTATDAPSTPASQTSAADAELLDPLSDRELEVLQLIAEGLTNQEVANRLYLSLHTVKVHARNIFSKLGVKNRTQAVAKGRALGLLPPI
ncbi:MAG: LuxR C-terminal-related transcriptional regulator [Candidatus Promineifilaceae bacterium]